MLGCAVAGYTKACSVITGGTDLLLVGDANDFNFTKGVGDAGYTAIARRSGATAEDGANLFEIESVFDSIGVDISQSNTEGTSSAWEYVISARLAQMSQAMTAFNEKIDAAAVCCQLVFIWRMNDGKIFVAGEKYVGGSSIPRFKFRQDGSKISGGKKFTDFNGQDLSLKSTYSRPPYEFTGGMAAIEPFLPDYVEPVGG